MKFIQNILKWSASWEEIEQKFYFLTTDVQNMFMAYFHHLAFQTQAINVIVNV